MDTRVRHGDAEHCPASHAVARVLIGVLVLGLCAWRTTTRAQDWRSDEALWSSAQASAPTLPRPALNLAVAYGRMGRWEESVIWTHAAIDRLPRQPWVRPHICRHVNRLMVILPDPPSFSLRCAS